MDDMEFEILEVPEGEDSNAYPCILCVPYDDKGPWCAVIPEPHAYCQRLAAEYASDSSEIR